MKRILAIAFVLAFALLATAPAKAQLNSNTASVSLSFTAVASLSITATPGSISFDQTGTASGPITVTTTWNLPNSYHSIIGYAYFSTSTALTGPANIPASGITAFVDGSSMGPFTQSDPTGATNGIQYTGHSNINFPAKPFTGNQVDTVVLNIPNAGNYTPGSYTGTLNFLATAA